MTDITLPLTVDVDLPVVRAHRVRHLARETQSTLSFPRRGESYVYHQFASVALVSVIFYEIQLVNPTCARITFSRSGL